MHLKKIQNKNKKNCYLCKCATSVVLLETFRDLEVVHHSRNSGVEHEGDEEEKAEHTDDAEGAQKQAGSEVWCQTYKKLRVH